MGSVGLNGSISYNTLAYRNGIRMPTSTTTLKQIKENAFNSIMNRLDFGCNHADRIGIASIRRDFVLDTVKDIDRLICFCWEIGALNSVKKAELARLNLFFEESNGNHLGSCSSIK